jgi:hypothetical protein
MSSRDYHYFIVVMIHGSCATPLRQAWRRWRPRLARAGYTPYLAQPRPGRPGGAGGHGRGYHAMATCRILRDPNQAGQPGLGPAAIAHGLRAVLGAGAAGAGATARLYALLVGLLYAVVVPALVEVGLYAPGRVGAALGAYALRGSVTLEGAPRQTVCTPRWVPGRRFLHAASITKWRCASAGTRTARLRPRA